MDHPADVDAVRKTAVRFLQDLLDNAVGKPTFQTASNIVELAFDSEVNPLIELFRTVSTNGMSCLLLAQELANTRVYYSIVLTIHAQILSP